MADKPVQHTPKHLDNDSTFDSRHPAASAFAPAQPAAGVVADDVPEKGQNLAGGPVAEKAETTFSDQKDVLAEQHEANLRVATGNDTSEPEKKPAAKKAASSNDSK